MKPAAPAVMATGLYAGTTLADDGSPILLFDPAGIAQVEYVKLEMLERTSRIADAPASVSADETPVLLFRGLDGARRAMRLAVVDRIEEVPSDSIRPGAGQLGSSSARRSSRWPASMVIFRARRSACSASTMAHARLAMRSAKSSTSPFGNDLIPATSPGEISAVTLVSGEPAEVDPHWLFANFAASPAGAAEQPVCRLPADDPWMQNMLRPIVEAAGYRVVSGDDDEPGRPGHPFRSVEHGCGGSPDDPPPFGSRSGIRQGRAFIATTALPC